MQCPDCQHPVMIGESFCENCGRNLSDLSPSPPQNTAQPSELAVNAPAGSAQAPQPMTTPPAQTPPVQPAVEQSTPAVPSPAPQPEQENLSAPGNDPSLSATFQSAAYLLLKDGSARYELAQTKEMLIGRVDPMDGIYPDIDLTEHDIDMGVSRRHATIHEQGGQWFIKDLGSTNYTVVGRQRLNPHNDFLIENGDEIRFSRIVFTFHTTG